MGPLQVSDLTAAGYKCRPYASYHKYFHLLVLTAQVGVKRSGVLPRSLAYEIESHTGGREKQGSTINV